MPSDEEIEDFQRNGYLVVPDMLSDGELQRFGAAVDAAVTARIMWGWPPLRAD
jgi:hypothetical protein